MFGKKNIIIVSLATALLLVGCGSDNNVTTQTYKVTLKNLTLSQTFSPAAVVVQNPNTNFNVYEIGTSASVALENLAEGGSPTSLLDEAKNANVLYQNSFSGAIGPGQSGDLTFTVDNGDLKLSIASMLIKTNDGFIGINNTDLKGITKKSFNLNVYDAGTESNDELSSTVPALGGTGFDVSRSDTNDIITLHPGIVSSDDGLSTSGLKFTDKWDNPAATLTIEKIH